MPPKRGKTRAATSQAASSNPTPYDPRLFVSQKAFDLYLSLTSQPCIVERPVLVGEEDNWKEFTELKEKIAANIRARGWEKWVGKRPLGNATLVREFYANARAQRSIVDVKVRGKKVTIDEVKINRLFDIPLVYICRLSEFKKQGVYDLEQISLALADTPHAFDKNDETKDINRSALTLEARFWVNFIMANVEPVEHASDFHFERTLFLYAIMTGMDINVGIFIRREIYRTVVKSKASLPRLWFANLISALLLDQGVEARTDDAQCKEPPPLSLRTIRRIIVEREKNNARVQGRLQGEPEEEGQGQNEIPPPANQEAHNDLPPQFPQSSFDFNLLSQHLNYVSQGINRLDGVFGLVSSHLNVDISSFPPLGPPPPPFYYPPPPRPPSPPGGEDMEE